MIDVELIVSKVFLRLLYLNSIKKLESPQFKIDEK